jgi:pilus assembly protein CpaC
MQTRSPFSIFSLVVNSVILIALAASIAVAQESSFKVSFDSEQKEPTAINVLVGQSRIINFDKPIGRFSVSDPAIAEAILVAPEQVLVNGKAFGQVNFLAWEKEKNQFMVFDVFVRANLSLIDSQVRTLFPKDDIRLSQANGSVVISGKVSDPKVATQVESVIQAAGFKTVNMLSTPTKDVSQVQLQVRVVEVSRNRLKDFAAAPAYQRQPGQGGYTNTGTGPWSMNKVDAGSMFGAVASTLNLFVMGGDAFMFIRALQQQGSLRALAEPNLIAMDGQQASFLAGGEFPIPVVQSGTEKIGVSIMFKEYGVRLNFKPTIIDEDHIRLELEPEVSTIDWTNGVRYEGFTIPALRTRRAKTGVELRDGQSFALAGLLDNNEMQTLSKIPVIGDIPLIGNLFKSKSFQKNETELMFICTVQTVKPVNRDDLPQLRGIDGLKNGSPLGVEPKEEGVKGETGHATTGTVPTNTTPAKSAEKSKTNAQPAKTAANRTVSPVIPVAKPVTGLADLRAEMPPIY